MAETITYKFITPVSGVVPETVASDGTITPQLVLIDLGNSVLMKLPVDPEVKPKVGTIVTIKVEIPMEKTDV